MAKSKVSSERAAKEWGPLSPEEIQAERADQLLIELEQEQERLEAHGLEGTEIRKSIRDLKRQAKTAKRLSVKQRARINTLDRQWRRQWVKEYDRFRAAGKDKKYASALAWSQVKVHCKKASDGVWECPPWRSVYKEGEGHDGVTYQAAGGKKSKAKKKAKKKKAKKGL